MTDTPGRDGWGSWPPHDPPGGTLGTEPTPSVDTDIARSYDPGLSTPVSSARRSPAGPGSGSRTRLSDAELLRGFGARPARDPAARYDDLTASFDVITPSGQAFDATTAPAISLNGDATGQFRIPRLTSPRELPSTTEPAQNGTGGALPMLPTYGAGRSWLEDRYGAETPETNPVSYALPRMTAEPLDAPEPAEAAEPTTAPQALHAVKPFGTVEADPTSPPEAGGGSAPFADTDHSDRDYSDYASPGYGTPDYATPDYRSPDYGGEEYGYGADALAAASPAADAYTGDGTASSYRYATLADEPTYGRPYSGQPFPGWAHDTEPSPPRFEPVNEEPEQVGHRAEFPGPNLGMTAYQPPAAYAVQAPVPSGPAHRHAEPLPAEEPPAAVVTTEVLTTDVLTTETLTTDEVAPRVPGQARPPVPTGRSASLKVVGIVVLTAVAIGATGVAASRVFGRPDHGGAQHSASPRPAGAAAPAAVDDALQLPTRTPMRGTDKLSTRATDPRPLALDELSAATYAGRGGQYTRTGADSSTDCTAAVDPGVAPLLTQLKCSQATSVTATSGARGCVVTFGALNLPDEAAAGTLVEAMRDGRRGSFIPRRHAKPAEGDAGGPESTWWFLVQPHGHWVTFATAGYASGKQVVARDSTIIGCDADMLREVQKRLDPRR